MSRGGRIERIWWEMFVVYRPVIYIITLVLLIFALDRPPARTDPCWATGSCSSPASPSHVILVIMLVIAIHDTMELGRGEAEFKVKVVSHHWWFEVHYPELGIVDANEINIPAGIRTHFELHSHGVVHSFWVPRLGGKRDMLPDHPTHLTLTADQPGEFRGTCAEYCAGPHALMAFRLIAHDRRISNAGRPSAASRRRSRPNRSSSAAGGVHPGRLHLLPRHPGDLRMPMPVPI
jgi:cytochrome c oxidase subunit II